MSIGLDRFFDILPLDLGKLWSFFRVKQPTRPLTAQERTRRFHWVTVDGKMPVRPDDLMGYVYSTRDNKAVYWMDNDDKQAKEAYYLNKSPEQLLTEHECAIFDDIRESAGVISDEDRKNLICDYYGQQKGLALLANTLA